MGIKDIKVQFISSGEDPSKRPVMMPKDVAFPIRVKPSYDFKENSTLKVYMFINHKCNAKCDYCVWFRDLYIPKMMTPPVYTRILDEIAKRKDVTLLLAGGEPTTSPHLPDMIEYAVSKNIKFAISTNFLRPLEYFNSLPQLDKYRINIAIHMDIFKDKPQSEVDEYVDKIITFNKTKPGKKLRVGVVIDERYIDRVVGVLDRLKGLRIIQYPILIINADHSYAPITQTSIDRIKPYFSEVLYKYEINGEQRDMLDDSTINQPNFNGYWCKSAIIEVFVDGSLKNSCDDKIIGNILEEDNLVRDYNPLRKCTTYLCDNFTRLFMHKQKYGKHT